jgi:hypothetical protein
MFIVEDAGIDDRHYMKRGNSSSTDSPNGNSNNDSSPCTSDTGRHGYLDPSLKYIHVKITGIFIGLKLFET